MARGRVSLAFSVAAVVLLALALARLADAVGKRELVRAAREVEEERARAQAGYEQLLAAKERLEIDQKLLNQRIEFMSKRQHYLVIRRGRQRLQLVLGDKELLEVPYRLRGSTDGVVDFLSLPKGKFEILGKRVNTDWYTPDWVFRLQGVEPLSDSGARIVRDAFGPGELFLGGAISIHGAVREEVPEGAIDHTYVELDEKSLKAVVNAVGPGSLVFIE